jgi:hypothetical protein
MLTERVVQLGLALLLAGATQAAEGPRFYQHIEVKNPVAAVEKLLDEGWSIRGYPPLSMTTPIDWAADPYHDSNWRYQLNAMYPLAPAFQLLADSYDPGVYAFVRRVFDDWIRFNLDENNENPFRWNDMASGIRATYLAQLIVLEREHGDDKFLSRLLDAAHQHLEELADPKRFSLHNHGLFQVVGIAALCSVISSDDCAEWMKYSVQRYDRLLDHQFDGEGMHLEHSPGYHLLALETFDKIEKSGLLKLSEDGNRRLQRARFNLQFLIHPDGGFAEIGDTEAASARGAARFSQQARWLTSNGAAGVEPLYGVWTFPLSGYAAARQLDRNGLQSYLILFAGHHSRVHKHLDWNTFEWSDRGRRILVDSGKWGYESSDEREYFLSPRAHNTVVTTGVTSSPGDVPPRDAVLEAWEASGVAAIVSDAVLVRKYLNGSFRRMLVMKPGEWLVVADEIQERLPGEQTLWFHFPPDADVSSVATGFQVTFPQNTDRLAVLGVGRGDRKLMARGETEPELLGWHSSGYHQLTPSWQVGFKGTGREVHFITVFRWLKSGQNIQDDAPLSDYRKGGTWRLCWREDKASTGVVVRPTDDGWSVKPCE